MSRKLRLLGKTRTITKRTDGRWTMNFTYNGKRSFVYHSNQAKCIEMFKKAYSEREKLQRTVDNDSMTLSDWMDIWYKTYKEPNLARSSLESILFCRSNHIDKVIGEHKIKAITTLQIQSALNKITGTRQRQIVKNHLSNAFSYALKNRIIRENPMEGVEVKHKTTRKSILTVPQQKKLLESIEDPHFKILILLF